MQLEETSSQRPINSIKKKKKKAPKTFIISYLGNSYFLLGLIDSKNHDFQLPSFIHAHHSFPAVLYAQTHLFFFYLMRRKDSKSNYFHFRWFYL